MLASTTDSAIEEEVEYPAPGEWRDEGYRIYYLPKIFNIIWVWKMLF